MGVATSAKTAGERAGVVRALLESEHRLNGILQQRNVRLRDLPDPLQVNAQVVVDEHVPEGGDALPFRLWPSRFQVARKALTAFRQYLEVLNTAPWRVRDVWNAPTPAAVSSSMRRMHSRICRR